MAGLEFTATIDNNDFNAKLTEMQKSMENVARKMDEHGAMMENMFDSVAGKAANLAAQFGIGFSAVGFIKQAAMVRGEFQALEQSFKTLLGNEEKANELMQQLTKTAAITPFDLQGVARGAKQLLAYGVAAEEVNDTIIKLGDIASGMGLSIDYITQLYGTTVSKANMDTMDLKQFKGQGIAIDKAIAEVMQVSQDKVASLISSGEVTGDIVKAAISRLASEGGQFEGMMVAQSKTILGQISNLEDAISSMFNDIGKSQEGIISDVLSGVITIVENYEAVGKAIAGVCAAYGTYKGVLIALSAYQGSGAKMELEALRELTAQVEATGDAELEELVRKGALTEAEAKEILALREEIEQREKQAQAAFDQARAEKVLTNQAVQEANANLTSARAKQAELVAREQALRASLQTATGLEAEQIQRNLNTIATERESAAINVANAEKAVSAATSRQAAAGEAVEVAQRNLNTISIQRQTLAQKAHASMSNMLAIAQKGLKKALDATGLSLLANPYVAAAAAIAAVGYAIYHVTTYTSDYEKSLKGIEKARAEELVDIENENKKLDGLVDTLRNAEKGTEDYEKAKQDIITSYRSISQILKVRLMM